ncbi:MAG: thioredoxin domain-containing protein [Pseudomonadota bacterium]
MTACANQPSLQAVGVSPDTSPSASPQKARFNPFEDDTVRGPKRREVIANPTLAQVLDPGPLPPIQMGSKSAPVTVIKYASPSCPYCRLFQKKTFPAFKRQYIDTGKVRFVLREFPIGFQSGAATIAIRCAAPEKRFALYAKFLEQHARWVSQEVRREPIFQIAKQVGMTRATFDACYENQELIAKLKQIKERGRTLGIIGTPNFFINERREKRVLTLADLSEIIDPLVSGAAPVASSRAE